MKEGLLGLYIKRVGGVVDKMEFGQSHTYPHTPPPDYPNSLFFFFLSFYFYNVSLLSFNTLILYKFGNRIKN